MDDIRAVQGEKIDLHLGKGPYYRTMIDEVVDGWFYTVPLPTYKGIPIILSQDQEINMYFYRHNGRYVQAVKVTELMLDGDMRLVRLRELGAPERQQRREHFRVPVILQALIKPFESGKLLGGDDALAEEVLTSNISATGVAVLTRKDYRVGDRAYLRILLTRPQTDTEQMDVIGEVRQVINTSHEQRIKQLGIIFLDLSVEASMRFERFVFAEQQRIVKQQKLMRDDESSVTAQNTV